MSTHKITVKWDLDQSDVEISAPEPGAKDRPRVKCPHCGIFTLWRRVPTSCNEHLIERAAAMLAKDIDRQILEELLNDPSIRKANPRGV